VITPIGDGRSSFRVRLPSGAECVLSLRSTWVEPLVFAGEVESPVLLEVAVADGGAEGEDGFGAVQAPSGSANGEAVGDDLSHDRPPF
jgi:hypothetical protein